MGHAIYSLIVEQYLKNVRDDMTGIEQKQKFN